MHLNLHINPHAEPQAAQEEKLLRNKELADNVLWENFKTGSKEAFEIIFDRHIALLYKYGYRITKDFAVVEDCVQELFIELWQKRAVLGTTSSIKFYLFKSLRRRIIRKLNQNKKYLVTNELPEDYSFEIVFSPELQLINNQITDEQMQRLEMAMAKLTGIQKETIYLKYYLNLSFKEITNILSITPKAAYNLIFKALQILKKSINKVYLLVLIQLIQPTFFN